MGLKPRASSTALQGLMVQSDWSLTHPWRTDQTAYTSEVQPKADGAEKSVDREKSKGQW